MMSNREEAHPGQQLQNPLASRAGLLGSPEIDPGSHLAQLASAEPLGYSAVDGSVPKNVDLSGRQRRADGRSPMAAAQSDEEEAAVEGLVAGEMTRELAELRQENKALQAQVCTHRSEANRSSGVLRKLMMKSIPQKEQLIEQLRAENKHLTEVVVPHQAEQISSLQSSVHQLQLHLDRLCIARLEGSDADSEKANSAQLHHKQAVNGLLRDQLRELELEKIEIRKRLISQVGDSIAQPLSNLEIASEVELQQERDHVQPGSIATALSPLNRRCEQLKDHLLQTETGTKMQSEQCGSLAEKLRQKFNLERMSSCVCCCPDQTVIHYETCNCTCDGCVIEFIRQLPGSFDEGSLHNVTAANGLATKEEHIPSTRVSEAELLMEYEQAKARLMHGEHQVRNELSEADNNTISSSTDHPPNHVLSGTVGESSAENSAHEKVREVLHCEQAKQNLSTSLRDIGKISQYLSTGEPQKSQASTGGDENGASRQRQVAIKVAEIEVEAARAEMACRDSEGEPRLRRALAAKRKAFAAATSDEERAKALAP